MGYALALPVLSALLVMLSGQPSTGQISRAFVPAGKAGETEVVVGAAATVLSSVHYQARLVLTCADESCAGKFPKPGAKRRLNVTRITCFLVGTAGSTFSIGGVQLQNATDGLVLDEYLPGVYSSSNGAHTLNQAIDIQVSANWHIAAALVIATGDAVEAACTATGTLDTLQ